MTDDQFWSLIERLDLSLIMDDEEEALEPLVEALAAMEESAVIAFEEKLAERLFALDTRAHASEIGESGWRAPDEPFSVDGFLYARCLVVARGRQVYEATLADPSLMPKDEEFESLLYAASNAHERRTGEDWDHDAEVSYETFSNRAGWA